MAEKSQHASNQSADGSASVTANDHADENELKEHEQAEQNLTDQQGTKSRGPGQNEHQSGGKPGPKGTKTEPQKEYGGPKGLEPTRYGDWEKNGRCTDF